MIAKTGSRVRGMGWSPAAAGGLLTAILLLGAATPATAQDFTLGGDDDPRVGLGAGWFDAEEASWNMTSW